MKVALVYDRVNKFGGAERILLALHEIYPEAPLYTSVYDPAAAGWANVFEVRTSFLQNMPLPKNTHESYPFLMGAAFETFNFDDFDIVISVTHEFSKAVITKPGTFHICYCLNPVGYIWDSYTDYFSPKSFLFKTITLPVIKYLRWYDRIVAQRPDKYLSISRTVQERIGRIYKRKSEIIYPPVRNVGLKAKLTDDGFYLIVSRLAPQKRIDIAIVAFNNLGLPLKIIGKGKEENRLKKLAKNNIEFLGYLTDAQVDKYYETCHCVVIPGEEDFNIVAVEAQSFGKPVVAFGSGGVTETVIDRKTGWFFNELKAGSLESKIREISKIKINSEVCKENFKKFSEDLHKRNFKKAVEISYLEYVRNA